MNVDVVPVVTLILHVEFDLPTGESAEERAAAGGTMSCQELLALSGALSAALPTGQVALDSFFEELTKGISKRAGEEKSDSKVRCKKNAFVTYPYCLWWHNELFA